MFSLVVPTFNRPFYLKRLLNYYADREFIRPLVVADSSSGEQLDQNREIIQTVQGRLDISHRIFPADIGPYAKLASTLGYLDEPYTAVCADDDFILPDAVDECVRFLKDNPGYSIAHGRATSVLVSDENGHDQPRKILSASTYPQGTIEFDSARERLLAHLTDYTATYYSVHRTHQLANNLKKADEYSVDFRFGELIASCLSIIQGKAKCLSSLYMVRQAELISPTQKYSDRMLPWNQLVEVADFSGRYEKLCACLIQELAGADNIPTSEGQKVIDRGFFIYLEQTLEQETGISDQRSNTSARATRFLRTLPAATQRALLGGAFLEAVKHPRNFYRSTIEMRDEMSLPALLDRSSPFNQQFLEVYKHLAPSTYSK